MKVITDAGAIEIGTTEAAPTIGLTDYSRRETDDFGVTTVVKRNFSRTMSVRVMVPTANVDALQRQLAALRAKPVQWVADDRFDSLSITGFYKDLSIDLAIPPVSYCTLTIEGLAEGADYADPGTDPATDQRKSTLRLLRPASIDDAVLTSSNVPENDYPAWSASATYALGARVILSSTHRIYESAANGNVGNDPTGTAGQWIDIAPTNRWAMFDQALGSQTERASSIVVSLDPIDPIDAVALLDVTAASVRVQAAGYDRTLSPAIQPGAVTFLDLPATAGAVVITISGSGTVSAGTLLIGKLLGLGTTEASPTAAITDYSRKETDAFGDVTVVERAWAKRMDVKSLISTAAVDVVAARIANVRAMPALWIGDATLESLAIYGFFKDFSIAVDENVSTLSLSIEGLSTAAKLAPLGADVSWSDIKDDDPAHSKPEDGATVGATPEQVEQIADAQFTADAAQAAITAAQQQIATIEASVTADFSAVNQAVAALNTEVDAAQGNITSLQTQAAGIIGSIGDINTEVDQISSLVSTQGGYISTLQQSVTNLSGTVSTLSSTVATQGGQISTNAQAITTLSGSVATLSNVVSASSNPNLIPGIENGLTGWTGAGFAKAVSGGWGVIATRSGDASGLLFLDSPDAPVFATAYYTAAAGSALFMASGIGSCRVEIIFKNSAFQIVGNPQSQSRFSNPNADFDNTGASRSILTVTGQAPASAVYASVRLTVDKGSGTISTAAWRQVKLEQGLIATPYSGEASAAQVFTAYADLNSSFASLSTTVSSQGGSISTLQSSYTSLNGTVSTLSSTVTAQGTSITNLQSASSTQAGQIATITTQLAAGNANLLPNSTFENGLSNWDIESVAGQTYGTFSSSQGVYFYVSSGAEILPDGFYYISNQARIVCGEGEVFTATANTDLSGPAVSGSSGTYLEFLWFNGASLHSSVAGPYHAGAHSFSQSSTNRPLSKLSAACPAGANRVSVRFVGRVAGGGVNHIGVQTVKLERGSVATPYSQEASVGQSFQAISTINESLASLSSTVSTQGATISQNATAISTLQGQQASLSSTVSAQGSSITNLQTATATLQGNVATLTTRVSASGANILPNGGLENGFATGVDEPGGFQFYNNNDWGPLAITDVNGLHVFYFSPVLFPFIGRSYTFSVDPLALGTSDIYCNIQCVDAGGAVILDGQAHFIPPGFDFDNTDTRRGQIACTVTVPSGTNKLVCRVYGTVRNGDPIGFRRAKLENGSQWSRYSAEATAVQQFQTLSTLNTQYASLSSTVSTQGVTISTQATAITTLNGDVATLFGRWGIEIDVNGYISGVKLNNNGQRSDLAVRADKFSIIPPSGTGERFEYSNNNIRIYHPNGNLAVRLGVA